MTFLHAIILGLVEGLTEFLPISSTGHLVLTSHLLGIEQTEFLKTFEIFIQNGALLAILLVFVKKLWKEPVYIKNILVSFLPTAIVGIFVYKEIKQWLANPWIVVFSLVIGGVVLILIEWYLRIYSKDKIDYSKPITLRQSLWIGVAQVLAFVPGVSRSGTTIVSGLLLGISRPVIVEFSFLLAVPTIIAASSLDIVKSNIVWNTNNLQILSVGFIVAFISALFATKWFLKYISSHSFVVFGLYRIAIAIIFIIIYL